MEFTTNFGLHSQTTRLQGAPERRSDSPYGPYTRYGSSLNQENLDKHTNASEALPNPTVPNGQKTAGFRAGLIPVHSPLLRESLLVSFPPLIDMLKFSG